MQSGTCRFRLATFYEKKGERPQHSASEKSQRGVHLQRLGNGAVAELGQTRLEHIDSLQNCALALRQRHNCNEKK
jgi:hypothetical protein